MMWSSSSMPVRVSELWTGTTESLGDGFVDTSEGESSVGTAAVNCAGSWDIPFMTSTCVAVTDDGAQPAQPMTNNKSAPRQFLI